MPPVLADALKRILDPWAIGLACALLVPATSAFAQWELNGFPVCTASGDQDKPAVVADGQGGAYIIWEDRRGADPQIYAQRLDALGVPQWGVNGMLVSSGFYPQYGPVAVSDASGGVIIAWILSLVPGSAEGRGQRLDATGTPQWSLGGIPVTPGAAIPQKLAIISDNRLPASEPAGMILAWTDLRSGTNLDIYIEAVDAFGVQRWGGPVCTAAGDQDDLHMVTDGGGTVHQPKGAILTWKDHRAGPTDGDIYAQRVNRLGVVQWAIDGIGVATEPGGVQAPRIVPAGSQNAIVCWPGPAGGRTYGLYADRVGTAGSWGGGIPLTIPNNGQGSQFALSDPAGGIIATWSQPGPGLTRDIGSQRLNSSGVRQWGDAGKLVCVSSSSEYNPVMVFGRSNTYVVVWTDNRNSPEGDLYAQLIDANGDRMWTPEGMPLCTAPSYELEAAAARDSTGGAIVGWTDYRNGGKDIYVNRVTGSGGVVAVEIPPVPIQCLALPTPNPTRGSVELALQLPAATEVTATVHDVTGRRVRTLMARVPLDAGHHTLAWDGIDEHVARVPAGAYWVSVRVAGEHFARRVVVLE